MAQNKNQRRGSPKRKDSEAAPLFLRSKLVVGSVSKKRFHRFDMGIFSLDEDII